MASPAELATALDAILDDEILVGISAEFADMLESALGDIELILKDLSLDAAGNVKPTTGNLKILNNAKNALANAINGADYQAAMNHIESGYFKAAETINAYMSVLSNSFDATPRMQALVQISIDSLTETIGASGLGNAFATQVGNALNQAITQGQPFRLLMGQIKELLTAEALMNVSRFNVKQAVTDSFSVMGRGYLQLAADRTEFVWRHYKGGKIKTTRNWCRERDGKYYHIKEIMSWGNDNWAGRMEGTTPQTIERVAGGYNCRHWFVPVSELEVPESAKQRFKQIQLQ